jgi:ribonuclease P protein component
VVRWRFDPFRTQRVPLAGHLGVDRCRMSTKGSFLVLGRRCQPKRHAADPRPVHPRRPPKEMTREQAHLPAEQPSPAQGPRIPPAHAHPCWSRDPLLASPQGPQEPVGLSRPSRPGMPPTTSTAHRLTGSARFSHAIRTGRRAGSDTLVLHLARADEAGTPRIGFVVSRAVGNAVTRNRVKRRLRELVRVRRDSLPTGSVLVVRALPPCARASYEELGSDLARCLSRVTS